MHEMASISLFTISQTFYRFYPWKLLYFIWSTCQKYFSINKKYTRGRVDGQKVGHFLITIQKSFKLIINQLWAWKCNSDESGFILKHISWIHFNLFLKKAFISLWKLCLKLTKCVTIEYSFNEIFWLSLQWLGHM